jgi:hypothetical protein
VSYNPERSQGPEQSQNLDEFDIQKRERHVGYWAHDDKEIKAVPTFTEVTAIVHDKANGDLFRYHLTDETEI